MEAFKLLSRSTNLTPLHAPKQERRVLHVPSEGQLHTSVDQDDNRDATVFELDGISRKRKRGASKPAQALKSLSVPSALGNSNGALKNQGKSNNGIPKSLEESSSGDGPSPAESKPTVRVSSDECRSIFKSQKVKISALAGNLSEGKTSADNDAQRAGSTEKTSPVSSLSRKKQKEASKIYTQPLTSFTLLRTSYRAPRTLSDNIGEQGYIVPTEVQLATIPLLLDPAAAGLSLPLGSSNIDLLTIAPTGSGKTLAFLVPLINHLVHKHHQRTANDSSRHLSALIVAPTKELVAQTVNEGRKLCRNTGVSITAMRKGMRVGEGGDGPSVVKADILVSTPLLLANMLSDDKGNLGNVRYLILDEADVLLDPLFRDQTLSLWKLCNHKSLRVSLWSATIGSNIEELVIRLINERRTRLDIQDESPLLRCVVGLKDCALPTISHKLIYTATEPGKLLGLRQLLHPTTTFDGNHVAPPLRPPFLVFTQTIERAVALHAELLYDIPTEAGGSVRIAVLHSDLSDLKRSEVMARFRKGQIWVLITTDLLSRGVDFRGVNGVVNYDIPTSSATYVHRVGRTGRAGREGGVAVTFYTRDDIKYVKGIANAIAASEKARGKAKVEDAEDGVQKWLLNALPDISKKDRQELKARGVNVRRRLRAGEDDKEAKAKRTARISTKSGYERRLENNRKGAIAGRQDGLEDGSDDDESDAWGSFDG
jgi:ATP-dependent RNA helicase DDX52/ROK1